MRFCCVSDCYAAGEQVEEGVRWDVVFGAESRAVGREGIKFQVTLTKGLICLERLVRD